MHAAVPKLKLEEICGVNRSLCLVEGLKRTKRETGNMIGKGVHRDAAELMRKGQ